MTAINSRARYGAGNISLKELAGLVRFKKDKNGNSMNLYCSSFQFLSDYFDNKPPKTKERRIDREGPRPLPRPRNNTTISSFDLRDVFDFENYKNLPFYQFLESKLNEIRDEVFTEESERAMPGSFYSLLYVPSDKSTCIFDSSLYLSQNIDRLNGFKIGSKINREYVMFILMNLLFRNKIKRSNIWNSNEF